MRNRPEAACDGNAMGKMRKTKSGGGFFLSLLINLLLNLRWSIPAWVLLALHFWLDISIWWFVGGLAFWIMSILADMWLIGWAASCGKQKDPPKENKNPYSVKPNRDTPG